MFLKSWSGGPCLGIWLQACNEAKILNPQPSTPNQLQHRLPNRVEGHVSRKSSEDCCGRPPQKVCRAYALPPLSLCRDVVVVMVAAGGSTSSSNSSSSLSRGSTAVTRLIISSSQLRSVACLQSSSGLVPFILPSGPQASHCFGAARSCQDQRRRVRGGGGRCSGLAPNALFANFGREVSDCLVKHKQ